MKALLKRMLRPFYRATKTVMRPIGERLRGPLSRLLYPPEFETVFRNLQQITDNLKGYVDQSDQLLLAMFRTLHLPPAAPAQSTFAPVNLGNGRVLTRHPDGGVMFLDADDLQLTPRILLGDYQPHVGEALRRLIRPGDCCVDFGAGVGYHTLTMARAAGCNASVLVVELEKRQSSLLRDNVTANQLACECFAPTDDSSPAQALRWLTAHLNTIGRQPDFVRFGSGLDVTSARESLRGWLDTGSPCLLLSTQSAWRSLDELSSLSLWRIEPDGRLFRSPPSEIDELGRQREIHFIAARALH